MALGNSTSMGQARGKNKSTLVKRTREHYLAKDFHAISGSLIVPSGSPCNLHNGQVTETYYHSATNQGIATPGGMAAGTYVFARKRANQDYYLPNGSYKITENGTNYFAITVANGRVASTPEACK